MNTIQLSTLLKSDNRINEKNPQVLALDEFLLQQRYRSDSIYVVNSDVSSQQGKHWFFIYVTEDQTYFLDSFAKPPDYYLIGEKLKDFKKDIILIKDQLQSYKSSVCGLYCLFLPLI